MEIAIVGTGYVGLVTGTCLASAGNTVTCVDIDARRIEELKRGVIPIYEPGLADLTRNNVDANRLRFTTNYADAVPGADICFIAVGTPQGDDGSADLQYVLEAARTLAGHMTDFLIVIDKSTVPVGTARMVEDTIRNLTHHEVAVISNPEFLKEGAAVSDFETPNRVVVGYDANGAHGDRVRNTMVELYRPFVGDDRPLVFMNRESAELTKYAANAMLATRISFINEIANLCERVGADIGDVSHGMGLDERIGPFFLRAGLGYGGSCFPKDVRAIMHAAAEAGCTFHIVDAVDRVNEIQKRRLADGVCRRFGSDLSNHTFAVWGLAFKPETDDMREAPSIVTIDRLLSAGATVQVHDPVATQNFMHVAERTWAPETRARIVYAPEPVNAAAGADALLLITEWNIFREPDWNELKQEMRAHVVFDGRNLYDRWKLEEMGFEYFGIGR
jgi:UDPglucose 6-dehydrogenase